MPRATQETRGSGRRAARRATERTARAELARTPRLGRRRGIRVGRLAVWGGATAVLLALAAAAVEHKVTWYLAVDQLGYLLFARDLLHGKIFHDWPLTNVLGGLLPQPTDVLAQTYVWDQGHLFSRYAPGFPIVLAGWTVLFGDAAAHALNPTVFLVLLGMLIALEWRVHRSPWRGTALAVLALTVPTGLSLWALTPTRDLSAHLCAFIGLVLLAGRGPLGPRRALGAGLALGYAASIRPDAVLYLVPAAVLGVARWRRRRKDAPSGRLAAAAALGVTIGLAPLLVYDWATTGNPFMPTQFMEVSDFLAPNDSYPPLEGSRGRVAYPPGAWRGTTGTAVSGGALKLAYLPLTLPRNWSKIRTAYGDVLLGLAACGLVVAAILRPAYGLAIGAYLVVALLFYSCWGRPYGRYLVSTWLVLPTLVMEGAAGSLDLVRWVARRGRTDVARGHAAAGAVALVVAHLAAGPRADGTALLALTRILALGTALALGAAALWPRRRVATVAVPALVLVLVALGCMRLWQTLASRAPIQRPQVSRAAGVVRRTLASPAVVVTSEEAGRPMENLEYYADVRALYLTDLERWHIPLHQAFFAMLVAEMEPYLLIPRSQPGRDYLLAMLRHHFLLELVQEIPPERSVDFFAMGTPMELWHIR